MGSSENLSWLALFILTKKLPAASLITKLCVAHCVKASPENRLIDLKQEDYIVLEANAHFQWIIIKLSFKATSSYTLPASAEISHTFWAT